MSIFICLTFVNLYLVSLCLIFVGSFQVSSDSWDRNDHLGLFRNLPIKLRENFMMKLKYI